MARDRRVLKRMGNQLIIAEPGRDGLLLAELVPYADVQRSRETYRGRHFGSPSLKEARKKAEWVRYNQTLSAFRAAVRGESVRYP